MCPSLSENERCIQDLEDINQTVVYIPFNGPETADDNRKAVAQTGQYHFRDIQWAKGLSFDAYRASWERCLKRIQTITHSLYAPLLSAVTDEIRETYTGSLPGLPFAELPVMSITIPSSSTDFVNQIFNHLKIHRESKSLLTFQVHVYPTDCVSITTSMKCIISQFLGQDLVKDRKPSLTLANYDIGMLVAWFKAMNNMESVDNTNMKLLIVLHDFEQCDPTILRDVFYIFSNSVHMSSLPVIFVLLLVSPLIPSYLQTAYPRSTLTLLRVKNFTVPTGAVVLETMLKRVFFDLNFEPDIMIGPTVIEYLSDYSTRFEVSVDTILNILQLMHLKHFSTDPLSVLIGHTFPVERFTKKDAIPFVDALFTRLCAHKGHLNIPANNWETLDHYSIMNLVDTAREQFYSSARDLRIGLGIVNLTQDFLLKQGYKGLNWNREENKGVIFEVLVDALKGDLKNDIKALGAMIRKLKISQIATYLEEVYTYFHKLPIKARSQQADARTQLVLMKSALSSGEDDITTEVGDWLTEFLSAHISPLENVTLWDVWYTGYSPFPSEMLNPSVRAVVISGLLRPIQFIHKDVPEGEYYDISKLSDTGILFNRYLDSGRMINVYDWFQSFQTVLETQRRTTNQKSLVKRSPRKSGKGNGKSMAMDHSDEDDGVGWSNWVQARFMRAMQELDYLGFLKHTGRKAEHVLRTVFEICD